MKVRFVPLEITVSRKTEHRCWPAEILYTTQESVFSKVVLLGALIYIEQEERGFDQFEHWWATCSKQVCAWVVQELPGIPGISSLQLLREQSMQRSAVAGTPLKSCIPLPWVFSEAPGRASPSACSSGQDRATGGKSQLAASCLFVHSSLLFLSVQAHLEAGDCRLLKHLLFGQWKIRQALCSLEQWYSYMANGQ